VNHCAKIKTVTIEIVVLDGLETRPGLETNITNRPTQSIQKG